MKSVSDPLESSCRGVNHKPFPIIEKGHFHNFRSMYCAANCFDPQKHLDADESRQNVLSVQTSFFGFASLSKTYNDGKNLQRTVTSRFHDGIRKIGSCREGGNYVILGLRYSFD